MYEFDDYFDLAKQDQPYATRGEELEDYLRLLDMLLESYLEYKGMQSGKKLFSRGLVITESEMTAYFDMPPYFRERDICDPVLSAKTEAAFSYIGQRTAATKSNLRINRKDFLRMDWLRETFSLNTTEILAVLLAYAVEIDRRYERIFGFLQDDVTKGAPSLGLLHALTGRITRRESASEILPLPLDDKMYTYFFFRKEEDNSLKALLTLQPVMKDFLMGIISDEINSPIIQLYEENTKIPLFFKESYRELASINGKENSNNEPLVYIAGDDDETVTHLLAHYCSSRDERLFVLDLRHLINQSEEKQLLNISELFLRTKLYSGRIAIRVKASDINGSENQYEDTDLTQLLHRICNVCEPLTVFLFGEKEEPSELAARFIPILKIPKASVSLRNEIWDYFLNAEENIHPGADVITPDLADCYEIPFGAIRKAIGNAIANAKLKQVTEIDRKLLLESLRQMNRVDFFGLATPVNPAYTWDDITITDEQRQIMRTACDRYRLRNRIGEGWGLKRKNAYGNGVSVLLYGPPGTGKTMAAQVIANELALPLYRVDISQIASKYIGETEKNLAVIFNAAAKANVILFFDEADALFTKRTAVGDSHDKYANSETSYLLQKIEEYDGMSILATNYYNNFDEAFVRRITYAIRLDSPDKVTRYTLWTTILPDTAEIGKDINFHFLADKFDLSGSNIKAILFNAAYMAGAENKPICMAHIIRAMEYEFNKLGKLVNKSEFENYENYLPGGEQKKKTTGKKKQSTKTQRS